MKFTSKLKKAVILCLVMVMGAMMLQGCGSSSDEKLLSSMKEFTSADESVSIYLHEKWVEEDMGLDNWLYVTNSLGTQACVVMQVPKYSTTMNVSSMDEMVDLVSASYNYTGTETDAPAIPGMTNITATEGELSVDGATIDGYVVYGETDYAFYALVFASNKMSDSFLQSIKLSCSKFTENAPEIVDNTTVELTDTVRWFNASYAVLTELNSWDYNRFGGLPANEESMELEKAMLEEWWSVTDRATADETLDWILTEGHRTDFASEMQIFVDYGINDVSAEERVDFLLNNFEMDSELAQFYADMFAMYEAYGETAIDGWDYCRAMNLLSYYYLAGYYTETEALDKSLDIAQTMQPLFASWDDLIDSYLRGYEYWAEESSDERRAIYEDIKTRDDNPYAVDFKMNLEKTW